MSDEMAAGSWELSPARRVVLRIATVLVVPFTAVGPAMVLSPGRFPLSPFVVVWMVFWVGICLFILSVFVRSVTRLDVRSDGRIEARRLLGTVVTDAGRVTSIGRSQYGQHGRRITRIRTADGSVVLAGGFPSVFDVATVIRSHNPGVRVDL